MNRTLTDLPFPASLLHPPYAHFEPVPYPNSLGTTLLVPGTLVALQVGHDPADLALLSRWVPMVRLCVPTAPVILRLSSGAGQEVPHLARRAGSLRVRAVLTPGEPIAGTLRRILTDPEEIPASVVEWLTLRGVSSSPVLGHLIQQIFTHGGRHAEVADLLRTIGEPETSARARFRKKGLPSPRRWLQAVRALRIAMRIQAEPQLPLLRMAFELGYGDHSALSQAVMRSFRFRPGELRGTLGWEWLLDRWLNAERANTRVAA